MKRRKLLATFLAALMAFTLVGPFGAQAAGGTAYMAGIGTYAVEIKADPVTTRPAEFGKAAGDGKVWTDKSVTVIDETNFEVTLSALAQEYRRSVSTIDYDKVPAADVTLILDITKSMGAPMDADSKEPLNFKKENNRAMNMIDAVNKTMDQILNANPNNRVEIVVFTNNGKAVDDRYSLTDEEMIYLPLAHYSLQDDSKYHYDSVGSLYSGEKISDFAGIGRYLEYDDSMWSNQYGSDYFQYYFDVVTSAGLQYTDENDGSTKNFSQKRVSYGGANASGTSAQRGIYVAMKDFRDTISKETRGADDVMRLPYVMLLTDGASTKGINCWYGDELDFLNSNSSISDGNDRVAAYTIYTAAYQKEQLKKAYETYNGEETEVTFFTLGIGGDLAADPMTKTMLNPASLVNDLSNSYNNNTELTLKDIENAYLKEYNTRGETYQPEISLYDYTSDAKKYIYPSLRRDGTPGYYTYCATKVSEMIVAFYDLAALVAKETNLASAPITSNSNEAGDAVANIKFTDVLGEGMTLTGDIVMEGEKGTAATQTDGTVKYTFEDHESYAIYNPTKETVTWYLLKDDMPVIQYKDRILLTPGEYANPNELPVTLVYPVGPESTDELSGIYYAGLYSENAGSAVNADFVPEKDNPYFYQIPDEIGTETSFPKKSSFANDVKTENTTGTAADISTTAFVPDTNKIKMVLGNNGSLRPVARITKDVNLEKAAKGNKLKYTIIVSNETTDTLANVVVRDDVPAGLTNVTASDSGTVDASAGTVTWTLASLAPGATKRYTIEALIPTDATATEFLNEVYIVAIDGYDLADPLPGDDALTEIGNPTLDDAAKFIGAQYVFDGTIRIKFFYSLQPSSSATDAGAGLIATQKRMENGKLVDYTTKIPFDETHQFVYREEGGTDRYYYFEYKTAAKNMTDDIILTYVDPDDNYTKSFCYNMRKYAEVILDDNNGVKYDTLTKDTMKAMLNYGAYTQKALGYRTDYLLNDMLSEEDRIIPETKYAENATFFTDNFAPEIVGGNDDISFYGCNLSLDEDVTLKVYYYSEDDLTQYKATVDPARGEIAVAKAPASYGDNVYVVAINAIGACQLNDMFTIELNGFKMSNFSPLAYGYFLELQNGYAKGNEKVQNLMKLMYAMVEYNGNMQSYDLEHHEYDENYEEKRTGNTDENPAGGNN